MHLAASAFATTAFIIDPTTFETIGSDSRKICWSLDAGDNCRSCHVGDARSRNSLFAIRRTDLEIDDTTTSISTNALTTPNVEFRIRDATYSDLGQVADLTTGAFFFSSAKNNANNPILRTIRHLSELDRLQNNFPYNNNIENDGRHFYLVATPMTDDTKIIGFCDIDGRIPRAIGFSLSFSPLPFATSTARKSMADVRRPEPYFSDLVVHPSYRRRGIASSLASEAESRAKNLNYDELFLCVRPDDDVVLQMYNERGYEVIETTKLSPDMLDFLSVQEGKILMRRLLR